MVGLGAATARVSKRIAGEIVKVLFIEAKPSRA
jgi:hypothetical protein